MYQSVLIKTTIKTTKTTTTAATAAAAAAAAAATTTTTKTTATTTTTTHTNTHTHIHTHTHTLSFSLSVSLPPRKREYGISVQVIPFRNHMTFYCCSMMTFSVACRRLPLRLHGDTYLLGMTFYLESPRHVLHRLALFIATWDKGHLPPAS